MKEFIVDEDFHPDVSGYPELVRCKDCKYRYNGCCYSRASNRINFTAEVPDDWFCADGERKDS